MPLNPETRQIPESKKASEQHDIFLSDPPRRPKEQIAIYWESMGISVPRRFDNLHQAIASERPFIIRSEHPQDYDSSGVSGLLESYPVSPIRIQNAALIASGDFMGKIDWKKTPISGKETTAAPVIARIGNIDQEELENELTGLSQRKIDRYLQLTGIDRGTFIKDISYSYWEFLNGINRTTIADNCVPNKYYLFSSSIDANSGEFKGSSYYVLQNGKISMSKITRGLNESEEDLQPVIKLYERLREMDGFDQNHRPVIESQSIEGQQLPLQYHRARDFQPAKFRLTRNKNEKEKEATFVRGATPDDGTIFDVNIYRRDGQSRPLLPQESALDFNSDKVHTGIMASRRKLQIVPIDNVLRIGHMLSGRHMAISQLFKPELTLGVSSEDLPSETFSSNVDNVKQFQIKVVSDGEKAFLEYM